MKNWLRFGYLAAVYLFLYFPIGILIVHSFNVSSLSTQWQGFTWHWYQTLMTNHHLIQVTLNSMMLGAAAATIATLLGTVSAICIYRYHFYGSQFLYLLTFILVIAPEIVIAVALLLLFSWMKIPLGFFSLLLAHAAFCMPFVTITIYSRLLSMDNNILKAAKELGASEYKMFSQIFFPLIKTNILTGWLISFTLSFDDVIISFFVSGPEFSILPLEIYSWVRLGIKPELNALCSILLGLTLGVVLISQLSLQRRHD